MALGAKGGPGSRTGNLKNNLIEAEI